MTDLHSSWDALLKAQKPATLAGYGIADGVNNVSVTGSGNVVTSASVSGHVLTLTKGLNAITSVSLATISDLHSSWDAVLKSQKPAWLTTVSLATISDLHASWDALLKAAPSAYVTRWPTAAEVGALTQTTADGRYVRDNNASGTTTDTNSALSNAVTHNYRWSNAPYNDISSLFDISYSNDWRTQLFVKHQASTDIRVRSRYNGTTWGSWRKIAFTDSNVESASKWATARTITLTGAVTGSVSIDGSGNVSLATTYATGNISALDSRYVNISGDTMTGNLTLRPLGGTWLNGKTLAPIMTNGASSTTGKTYHPIIWGKTDAGDVWNLGHGASDQVGFFGFYSERTVNGTDWANYIKVSTGDVYFGKALNVTGKTTTGSLQIGSGTITWDSATGAFHFSHGVYSDSFVSAKGANSSAGGTVSGVTKLSDLSDVHLGTLATNQVLSWNGSKWVNKAISTGLDETALAQYLTNNQYLTMPTGDARYVKKAGDMMTGTLTTCTNGTNSYNQGIRINRTALSNWATLTIGHVGTGTSGTSANTWLIGTPSNSHSLIFNLNGSSEKVGLCLKGTGTNDIVWNNQKVWHAGNDGSGSGLDADLLDGTHKTGLLTSVTSSSTTNLSVTVGGTTKSVADLYATYLDGVTLAGLRGLGYAMQMTTIDASSLNVNTWYPVTINIGVNHQVLIAVIVSLDSGTKPSWSTHQNGFSVRKVWYANGSGWGTNSINRTILFSDYGFTSSDPVRGLGQLSNSSNEYVYVRGGGKYHFYTSHGKTPVLRTSTYTINEQSVSPTTTAPAAISRTNALITDNVYSATQLQTARTINGTAFNGTSNIVTSYWGTARTLSLTGNATGSVSMNGSSNVSMSVNVNYAASAGNADTVDGLHATSFAIAYNMNCNTDAEADDTTISDTATFLSILQSRSSVFNSTFGAIRGSWWYVGNVNMNTGVGTLEMAGTAMLNMSQGTGSGINFKTLLFLDRSGTMFSFCSQESGVAAWSHYAKITDNVASATKLQTARSIWGRPFDGTAPVSGNMTGVGSFTGVGQFKYGASDESNATYGKFHRLNLGYYSIDHTDFYEQVFNFYSNGGGTTWAKIGSTNYFNGNVGIGTTSPSYKLHVSGSIAATSYIYIGTGWFQNNTSGNGLYNSAENARWYANGSGWVSDKKINANAGLGVSGTTTLGGAVQVPYTGGNWISMATRTNLIYSTTNNSQSSAHALFRVKANNGNALCFGGLGNELGFYAFTAANISSGTNAVWKNTYWDMTNWTLRHGGALVVTGAITGSSTIYGKTGVYSDGYVSAKGQNTSSDLRLKEVLSNVRMRLSDIAKAPAIRFAWKNGAGIDVGSSAQYWRNVLPDAVKERNGFYEMTYGNIALVSAILIAREVETHEQRIKRLENENKRLQKRIKELERRLSV